MKRLLRSLAVLCVVVVYSAAAAGDTLESVQKSIVEQGKKITSMSWNSSYFQDMETDAMKSHSEGTTAYEFTRSGELTKYRMETSFESVTETNGSKQTTKGTTTSVCDGEFSYVYSDVGGQKSVMKQKAQPQGAGMDQSYFDMMSKSYTLELQPDGKVGSRAAYVIKAVLKNPTPMMAVEQMMYFDKATGVMLKSVSTNEAGKVTMETTTTDLKVNSTISADRFVFHAPEGVPVIDMTQQGGQPQQAQQQETAQQETATAADDGAKSDDKPDAEVKAADEGKKKKKKKSKWLKLPKRKRP